ncbi:hypothetical protein [Vibrio campbellii]|uniref:hypothetical protein n=1 Tax=Vibrio campbellii TaxID=680 RepID=UPI0013158BA3|nr:hypothetical protein [Vibrio campbellii]
MKSILYESRVELLKIISAAVSIGTIVLLSHVLGDKFLVSYVVIQTLLVVFTSVIDFGQNVTNKNIEIPENTFRSQRIPIHFFLIALTIYFVVSFYWFSEDISYMVIFLMPISILSSTYNLRWLTVKRRSGNVFSSVLLGEFSLSILRLTSVIIGLILGYEFFELALLIFPIVVSLFLSKLRPINKLSILSPLDFNVESDKFDIFSYILSVFIAVKNQILSLFLPAVHDSSKSYVIMVSRIYGAIVILTSGLNARIPYSIKLAKIDNKWKSIKVILSLLLFSFILIALFYPMYVELVSSIFNVSFPFDFPLERQLFFALIVFGIVQSSMIVSLQCLNKNKTAILLDVLYLLVVIKFMTALK